MEVNKTEKIHSYVLALLNKIFKIKHVLKQELPPRAFVGPGPCIFPIEYAICQTGFWAICHMPCTVFWLMQYAISIYAYIGIFIGKSATYVGDTRF
jgi:hypothetical protein